MKRPFLFCLLFLGTLVSVNAQCKWEQLVGTKWKLLNADYTLTLSFSKKERHTQMSYKPTNNFKELFDKYYLANKIPREFDKKAVGKPSEGKYFLYQTWWDGRQVMMYEIIQMSADEDTLYLCNFKTATDEITERFAYKKIK